MLKPGRMQGSTQNYTRIAQPNNGEASMSAANVKLKVTYNAVSLPVPPPIISNRKFNYFLRKNLPQQPPNLNAKTARS